MTAATLRQTAAPDANVKSEIHMAFSLVLFRFTLISIVEQRSNVVPAPAFRELLVK
jgi:hypothetical protein